MAQVEIMNRRSTISNPYGTLTNATGSTRNGVGSSTLSSNGSLTIAQPQRSMSTQTKFSLPLGTRINCLNTNVIKRNQPIGSPENYLNQINEIDDYLYLSGARALTPNALRDLGICCVINVTVELPNVPFLGRNETQIETLKIPIDDSPYANIAYYFDRAVEKIDENIKNGKKVLVHCVAGVSRSSTIIIAFLMKHRQMTLRSAFEHVKSCRPIIRPNPGFFRQLIDFESRLFGKTTVKMGWNAAAGGNIPDLYEHEYLNTLNFINKYGCFHGRVVVDGGSSFSTHRSWPATAATFLTNRCSR